MRRYLIFTGLVVLGLAGATQTSTQAADDACRTAMKSRVEACTKACTDKARAAVDPSVRDLVIGRACTKNCLKIEMFRGNVCP